MTQNKKDCICFAFLHCLCVLPLQLSGGLVFNQASLRHSRALCAGFHGAHPSQAQGTGEGMGLYVAALDFLNNHHQAIQATNLSISHSSLLYNKQTQSERQEYFKL